jgi:hypothetical protein
MPLSRQTLTERSTMTEPPWLCIEACNVCGLGESVRIHTDNRVKKQLVVLFCWFVRFPNLWWVEWVGPEGCWNLPRLGFFLGCLDRTALRTFASSLLAPSLAGWLATPPLPPRTLACRTSPTSLCRCDDKTWSASAKLPNLDSCITYAFGVSSDDQKE